ncbi:hypothetical protein [Ramlibacter sp.]|uniref:hypothetical protein n=1 Tax=Ramlibacter sp. TaxID=1917967 RepID=UPI0017D06557|nr:hypothetical protein [Ramlibacter sp.]MBA2672502.1 hypothetical protein [Ramlibacter sp.]
MSNDQQKDRQDERSSLEQPADDTRAEHLQQHSGEGSNSALAKMKLWERARARLSHDDREDRKPQAD